MPRGGDPVHSAPRDLDRGQDRNRNQDWTATVLAVLLVAELLALMVLLVPVMGAASTPARSGQVQVPILGRSVTVDRSTVLVLVSLVAGALGGALHAVASLTEHLADDDFDRRWTTWYLTNPFVGAAVAVVFSFVLNVSVGGQPASTAPDSSYGIAAVATLSGLFSRHALGKLKEIFDVVVGGPSTAGAGPDAGAGSPDGSRVGSPGGSRVGSPDGSPDGSRVGSPDGSPDGSRVGSPAGSRAGSRVGSPGGGGLPGEVPALPRIAGLSPSSVAATSDDLPLTIAGSGFAPDSVVDVAGTRVPAAVGPREITLQVPATLVDREGELTVRVRSHGVWSNAAELEVLG